VKKLYTGEYNLEEKCRWNKKIAKGMKDLSNKDMNMQSKSSKLRVREKWKLQRTNIRILQFQSKVVDT